MNIKNILLLLSILYMHTAYGQVTQVQFINNCADQTLVGLDIYIDGQPSLPPEVNDVFFRESSPFVSIKTGSPVTISVADLNSVDVNDTFYSTTITLSQTDIYVVVIEGIESSTGYSPAKPFSMRFINPAKNAAAVGKTEMLFLNSATDAPILDVRSGVTTLANDLDYGDYSAYTEVSSNTDIKLRLTNPVGSKVTHTFDADISSLPIDGKAVTILTSGFVDPSMNSNGPAFGLWVTDPDGGPLTQLQPSTDLEDLARVQLIHNSADTAVGKLDIYVDDVKTIDSLDFRNATAYLDIFAKTPLKIGIAHTGTGTQFFDTSITLDSGKVYSAVMNGIKSDTNYKPLPDLKFDLFDGAREEATATANIDVVIMHGCTDAPVSRVRDIGQVPINAFANLNYGDFGTGYHTVTSGFEGFYIDTGSNNAAYEKYELNGVTSSLTGQSLTLVYSGFVVPDSNSKGPSFGLWMAKAEGGPLVQLPPLFISVDDIETSANGINTWPNPASNILFFENKWGTLSYTVTDISGKVVLQKKRYTGNQIETTNLSKGNYILLLETEENKYYSKFTKL